MLDALFLKHFLGTNYDLYWNLMVFQCKCVLLKSNDFQIEIHVFHEIDWAPDEN